MSVVERFAVGRLDCAVVSDGWFTIPPEVLFPGVPPEQLHPVVRDRLLSDGTLRTELHCLLVRAPDATVLVDAGYGALAAVAGVPAGRLGDGLASLGVSPHAIDTVVVTHGHGDHIGGVVDADGLPAFSRARHWFSTLEWEFWTSENGLSQVPAELAAPARLALPPLADAGLVVTADDEADVAPGVRLLPAPGHTPGHVAVALTDGNEGALFIGDAIVDPAQCEHPEWVAAVDHIPALTVDTRRRLLARAAEARSRVVAFHLPRSGVVERSGDHYRLVT